MLWNNRINWCGIALAFMAGCGSGDLVPLEGTITLDGKPLSGASIGLELAGGEKDFRQFSGETDANGRYVIKPFERSGVGALPGDYRVMISAAQAPPGGNELYDAPPDPVPFAYRNGSKTLTVPEGGTTNADFDIRTR